MVGINPEQSKDFHYFTDIAGRSPLYDWEGPLINVGCNVTDLDIMSIDSEANPVGTKEMEKLVHEYIHFLQNFSTAWGGPFFCDLSLSNFKIGASSFHNSDVINLPIDKKQLHRDLTAALDFRQGVLDRFSVGDNVQRHDEPEVSGYIYVDNPKNASLKNGSLTVQLGLKSIREHMAHMGTQLFLGRTDQQIHDYNEGCFDFKRHGVPFAEKPEYWIVFEYFFGLSTLEEIARGVFTLTQNCLATLNPEMALKRFLVWFHDNQRDARESIDLPSLVEAWMNESLEKRTFAFAKEQSIKHCTKILELCRDRDSDHDLFNFSSSLIDYVLRNLEQTEAGRTLFLANDVLSDLGYWKSKITKFGTGLVRYLDNVMIHGSASHCETMSESFYFLFTTNLIVKRVLSNKKTTCPFLYDFPICKHPKFDSDLCHQNPFLMVSNDPDGECLYGGATTLLGWQHRINFVR